MNWEFCPRLGQHESQHEFNLSFAAFVACCCLLHVACVLLQLQQQHLQLWHWLPPSPAASYLPHVAWLRIFTVQSRLSAPFPTYPLSRSHSLFISLCLCLCVFSVFPLLFAETVATCSPLFLPAVSADSSIIVVLARHEYSQSKPKLPTKTNQAKTSWPNVLSWSATELTVIGNIGKKSRDSIKERPCALL